MILSDKYNVMQHMKKTIYIYFFFIFLFVSCNNNIKEVEKNNGYELGTVVTLLVKQNEEQALYLIEQQKQIDELKAQIKNLERRK